MIAKPKGDWECVEHQKRKTLTGPSTVIAARTRRKSRPPIFHDDQHGTAIVCLAGLINAVKIADKKIEDVKVVLNGAGAAGMACIQLMNVYGVKKENTIVCNSKGVIYKGRTVGMNEYKEEFAAETDKRTLAEALVNADMFVGVSAAGALKPEYLKTMASTPIIFAMTNPEPEIRPDVAKAIRPNAITATGRSD